MSQEEKNFVSSIMALLAAADSLVGENIIERFSDEIQIPEARCFFGFQMMQKNIHSELFSLLMDVLSADALNTKELYVQWRKGTLLIPF